jgi:hypothetical protein
MRDSIIHETPRISDDSQQRDANSDAIDRKTEHSGDAERLDRAMERIHTEARKMLNRERGDAR